MTRRSLTSTMPADVASSSRAWLSDRPGWCVDVGETLVAMKTADLWLALAKDEVTPQTKVWREGMPYWTALEKVPEFALAMPDAVVWAPGDGPAKLGAPAKTSSTGARASATSATSVRSGGGSDPLVAGGVTMAPPSDFLTPAPVVVEHRGSEHVASGPRRIFPRMDRRGAMSVALGAIVAIAALTFATTGPSRAHGADDGSTSSPAPHALAAGGPAHGPTIDFAAPIRVPSAPAVTSESTASPALDEAPTGAASAPSFATAHTHARPGRGPHVADRGQRRAR